MPILPVPNGEITADENQFPFVGTITGKSVLQIDLTLQAIEQGQPVTFFDFPPTENDTEG